MVFKTDENGKKNLQAQKEIKVMESLPHDSIHKKQATHFLSRTQLSDILCKRLQFTHLGDSMAGPSKGGSAVTTVYHSLF